MSSAKSDCSKQAGHVRAGSARKGPRGAPPVSGAAVGRQFVQCKRVIGDGWDWGFTIVILENA